MAKQVKLNWDGVSQMLARVAADKHNEDIKISGSTLRKHSKLLFGDVRVLTNDIVRQVIADVRATAGTRVGTSTETILLVAVPLKDKQGKDIDVDAVKAAIARLPNIANVQTRKEDTENRKNASADAGAKLGVDVSDL